MQQTSFENGLETEEVKKRLADYGYNEVPEKKQNFWIRLGKRFWGIVPCMLEATAIVTYTLATTFLINDPIKVYLTRKLNNPIKQQQKQNFTYTHNHNQPKPTYHHAQK